jgi:[acyl-carrier-protein] S-malonyltransferase
LGEYAALVAANVLPFEAALQLVRRRGALMARSGGWDDAGMSAVIGLDAAEMDAICAEIRSSGQTVVVANYNCPGQTVVSGGRKGLTRASQMALDAGARRVIPLAVSGAFHSPLMKEAQGESPK